MRQGETEGGREGWRGREIDRVKKREGGRGGERKRRHKGNVRLFWRCSLTSCQDGRWEKRPINLELLD